MTPGQLRAAGRAAYAMREKKREGALPLLPLAERSAQLAARVREARPREQPRVPRRVVEARTARAPPGVRRAALRARAALKGIAGCNAPKAPEARTHGTGVAWALDAVRDTLHTRGGLANYVRCALAGVHMQRPGHAPRDTMFPLPLAELARVMPVAGARRGRKPRWALARAARNLTLLSGLQLTWEATGRPHAPAPPKGGPPSRAQMQAVSHLRGRAIDLLRGCHDEPLRTLGMGRGTLVGVWDATDRVADAVRSLERGGAYSSAAQVVAELPVARGMGAEPVDVPRVAWPKVAPALDLAELLTEDMRAGFVDPGQLEGETGAPDAGG